MSRKFIYLIIIYISLQVIIAFLVDIPFTSDSLRYFKLSLHNINHGVLYPSKFNLYDAYITSPLYINVISLFLLFFKQKATIIIFNIFLNTIQLTLVYKISLKILNNVNQAFIAGLLYAFYLTNLGAVFFNLTEFFYGVLLLLSFFYYLSNKKYHYILSGIFMALAINTRQTGFALLLVYGSIYLYKLIRKRQENHKRIILITS